MNGRARAKFSQFNHLPKQFTSTTAPGEEGANTYVWWTLSEPMKVSHRKEVVVGTEAINGAQQAVCWISTGLDRKVDLEDGMNAKRNDSPCLYAHSFHRLESGRLIHLLLVCPEALWPAEYYST